MATSLLNGKEAFVAKMMAKNENINDDMSLLSDAFLVDADDALLDFLDENETNVFFERLEEIVSNAISNLCSADGGDDGDSGSSAMFSYDDATVADAVNTLKRVVTILMKVSHNVRINNPFAVRVVQLLHELLIPLDDEIPGATQIKEKIARICEKWWINQYEGAEHVITQLIPYLLLTALSPSSHDADVKRLYNVRGALLLFDFDDETIESIRSLILRVFMHPLFLKVPEGRRFLSFIFSIDAGLNTLIFQVIKPQLAVGTRRISSAYGEILLKTWRELADAAHSEGGASNHPGAGDDSLVACFEEMLQGLMHDCIHAADQSYFRGLRFSLGAFHEAKRMKGVDSLLLRLYGPILFRSLRCANAVVRAQATMVFFDVFPLQDTDTTAAEADVVLQRQFDLLSSLLKDDDHRVRAAAASGVCYILREYWEALPSQTTHRILSYVVGTLGLDSSSPSVRLAVISGLGQVLEQPLAHSVLKGLLPLLSNALHDKSQAVRLAFVRVLNQVKDIRGIHFYQVVSVDHIQRQLAADAGRPAIRTAITELLLNSYYPQQQSTAQGASTSSITNNQNQVLRCLRFVRENLPASIVFYSTFCKLTSVGSSSKLLIMLLALFTKPKSFWRECKGDAKFGPADQVQGLIDARDDDRRGQSTNAGGNDNHTDISGGVMQLGVLRVMAACLDSIAAVLAHPEHAPSRDLLMKYFTKQTVANVSALLQEEGEKGGVDKAALPLFLQITATVWKHKNGADRGDLTASVDAAMNHFLSQYAQYPRDLQCSYAAAVAQLCRGSASVLLAAITKVLVDFEDGLIEGPSSTSPLGTTSLCAAMDIFGAAAVASEEVVDGLEGLIPRLRGIVYTVLMQDVDATATLLQRERSKPDQCASMGTCLVRAVLLWSTLAARLDQSPRDAADGAANLLGDVIEWTSKALVPSIGRCALAVDQASDASAHPHAHPVVLVLYDILASVLLVVTDALIVGAVQRPVLDSLAALMKDVLPSLDLTPPHKASDAAGVHLPAVLHRLESVLRSQYTSEFDTQVIASVGKVISALENGSETRLDRIPTE